VTEQFPLRSDLGLQSTHDMGALPLYCQDCSHASFSAAPPIGPAVPQW
jgi:hypothetical protein